MAFGVLADDKESPELRRGPETTALYLWGLNANGQTSHSCGVSGDSRTWRCQRQPQRVPASEFRGRGGHATWISDVACGLQHTAAVMIDGELFTWGGNEYGQLGDGSEEDRREPKRVEALKGEEVTAVACGWYATAALTKVKNGNKDKKNAEYGEGPEEGRLWVWGQHQSDNLPRLFVGAFPPRTVVKQVALGGSHAAAVSENGQLQTWGYNEFGQLGWGYRCAGRQKARLVEAFCMHLDDPPVEVHVTRVACGEYHTVAVTDNGDLYTWGLGATGQLGHRSLRGQRHESSPRRVASLEGERVCHVAAGAAHTCAVTDSGALYLWGYARDGQLGLGRPRSSSLSLAPSPSPSSSPLPPPLGEFLPVPFLLVPRGVTHVACGARHTVASLAGGTRLAGWGDNGCGQAATGRGSHAWSPAGIDWCVGEICHLAAGGGHTAVLTRANGLRGLCEFQLADKIANIARMHLDIPLRPGNSAKASGMRINQDRGIGSDTDKEALQRMVKAAEVAARHGAEGLLRFSQKFSERIMSGEDPDMDEDEERRRRPRGNRIRM